MSFFGGLRSASADDLTLADNGLSAGYATLAWFDVSGSSFVLEQKTNDGWLEVYRGGDRASTLSGLPDGTYMFRLTSEDTPAPRFLEITVKHHPLARAWTFFSIGAVMLVVLVGLLIKGPAVEQRHSFDKTSPDNVEQ